jgi:predicted nuclease with TOPRIM domain
LAKELEALISENASLVCKYDSLTRQYDKVIKSFAFVAAVDQENEMLEEKLGKLTSENMALQANHKVLECSYEKLVDSYVTLEIARGCDFIGKIYATSISHMHMLTSSN